MNNQYLMQHISYHLHTFVKRYDRYFQLLDSFCARREFQDTLSSNHILQYIQNIPEDRNIPKLLSLNTQVVYAWIAAGPCNYLVGPVRFSSPIALRLTEDTDGFSEDWLETVPICEFNDLVRDTLLIHNLHREDTLNESTFLLSNCIDPNIENNIQKFYSELVFQNRECGKKHNPYDQEIREFSSIEHGDLEQLKRSRAEDYTGEIGTLAKTPLRHVKNLGIVIVTLASRAAMRGGLLPEIAYSLSDSYIQKIEETNDIPTVYHIAYSSEFHYAQLVRNVIDKKEGLNPKEKNPHINRCKDYIFSHLHGKISVQEIADTLRINANYLSELFHKCEGVSITKFIQTEKIRLAKNLLIYSEYSYIEIATYLGYSSQSHLGKQFKQMTGYTLSQYRKYYGVDKFRE